MNPSDNFREQVQKLVAEGKLTAEEAEALLGARVSSERASNDRVPPAPQPAGDTRNTHDDAPISLVKAESGADIVASGGAVPPRLHLHVAGYSLEVIVEEGRSAPELRVNVEGRLQLLGNGEGWHVSRIPKTWEDRSDGWVERVLQGFIQEAPLRAELRVPTGITEVEAKVQGGNLSLAGVPGATVHAKVQGGNLTLADAGEVQAKVQGGNLNWNALVQRGNHDLVVQGGNANLKLLPGSSLRLDGDVTAGNLSAAGFPVTKTGRDPVSASYQGVLEDGRASLSLKVQGGNIRIAAPAPITQDHGAQNQQGPREEAAS